MTNSRAMGKELMRSMKKLGAKFHLKHGVKEVTAAGRSVTVKADNAKGEEITFKAEYCLVSVGRQPFTGGLNLEGAGLSTDERGRVDVNAHMRTNVPHIYAIGDLVRGAMLAHKAEEEGVFAAETIAGQHPHIDYNLIPNVVYTWPEVAGVGATEEQLKANGIETVVLGGFLTNCCVESTMRTAYEKGFNVITLTDACATASPRARPCEQRLFSPPGACRQVLSLIHI